MSSDVGRFGPFILMLQEAKRFLEVVAISCDYPERLTWAEIDRTRRVTPPGPRGRPRSSERDLVVAVDQPGVFVLGRLRAAEEIDLLGDDLAAVAVVACGIGPFRVVDTAVHEHLHALGASP